MSESNLLAGIILMFSGSIIWAFKAMWLIAGYNRFSLSKKEIEKYDKKKLTRFMGLFLIVNGIIQLLVFVVCYLFENMEMYFSIIAYIILIAMIVWVLIYLNTGNRFKKASN